MPSQGHAAVPMLCLPKGKTGGLRTVIDARQRNTNTLLYVTPLLDQQTILDGISKFRHRTKIDMTDAYEQIQVIPPDIWKTLFSSALGMYVSNTLQQGNCNGPSTFQQLMTWIL